MQHNYLSGQSRSNHKTMRISDKSLEFIMTFEGNTFNDQVNNMIDYFMNAKSAYEKELELVQGKIDEKKKLLNTIESKSIELNHQISNLSSYIRNLRY